MFVLEAQLRNVHIAKRLVGATVGQLAAPIAIPGRLASNTGLQVIATTSTGGACTFGARNRHCLQSPPLKEKQFASSALSVPMQGMPGRGGQ